MSFCDQPGPSRYGSTCSSTAPRSDSWYWHRVVPVLRGRGHDVVAPDLPCEDDSATFSDCADVVVDAIGDRGSKTIDRARGPSTKRPRARWSRGGEEGCTCVTMSERSET
jgi:hypothetical protein